MVETTEDLHTWVCIAQGRHQLAVEVTLGAHALGIPAAVLGVPQTEAVVMDYCDTRILGAGLNNELGPFIRIETLGLEVLDKVLVSEFRLFAVGGDVMIVIEKMRVVLDIF